MSWRAGVGDVEDDDVGLHCGRVDLDAGELGEAFGEELGVGVVLGEALDVVLEAEAGAGGDDARLAHRAAEHLLVAAGFGDQVGGACEAGADRGAEALGEVDPGGFEAPREGGGGLAGGDGGVEEAGAVEVGAQAELLRHARTSSIFARGQTRPPPRFVVCSTMTKRERGSWLSRGSRIRARRVSP